MATMTGRICEFKNLKKKRTSKKERPFSVTSSDNPVMLSKHDLIFEKFWIEIKWPVAS